MPSIDSMKQAQPLTATAGRYGPASKWTAANPDTLDSPYALIRFGGNEIRSLRIAQFIA
jgi:hypothetical protein